jgi:hypothetical protein
MTGRAARASRALRIAAALAPLAWFSTGGQGGSQEGARVSYGVKASADTVRIGDPFTVSVRVRAPAGAAIEFPAGPDSTSAVQLIDPRTVRTTADTAALDQTATYRLAAWDIGPQPIELGDVIVTGAGADRRISVGRPSVFVRSVLPADSTQRVPKPARPLVDQGIPRWWLWALIATAVALALIALWWWWRRRPEAPPAIEDPLAVAEREFARVEALRLIEAGESGRHVALMIDVLRDYLAARHAAAPLSHTTSELTRALHLEPSVPLERLSRLLDEADLIKFARRPATREHAMELGREARLLVRNVDVALAKQAGEARAAQEKAA